jgi:hypothetical protein
MVEDVPSLILQTSVGLFFALSGWHKLTHPERKSALMGTMRAALPKLGLNPDAPIPGGRGMTWLEFMCPWVAGWELFAGAVAACAVGWYLAGLAIVPQLAMVPCLVILVVALYCEGAEQVKSWNPLDWDDALDTWLYLPETQMAIVTCCVIVDLAY